MKAIAIVLGRLDRIRVRVGDVAEPLPGTGPLLVEGPLLGICGTDRDLVTSTRSDQAGRDHRVHQSRFAGPGGDRRGPA
jgi:threonine dehydrogenase-like Zn-dependent dehydrogenase